MGASTAPHNSFDPGTSREANTSTSVSGGTIYAYLVNSAGTIIADDSSVINMISSVNITSSTRGLKGTFVVTDNGASVIYDQTNNEIEFDSGPLSVSFEVIE